MINIYLFIRVVYFGCCCCLRTLLLCFALFFQDVVSRCRCRDSSLNTYWIRSKQLSVVDQTTMERQLSSIHIQTWLACVCHQHNTLMTIIMATRILQMLCKAQKFTLAILTNDFDSKNMTHSSDALRRTFFDNAKILFEWHETSHLNFYFTHNRHKSKTAPAHSGKCFTIIESHSRAFRAWRSVCSNNRAELDNKIM